MLTKNGALICALLATLALAGCGGQNSPTATLAKSTARGTLAVDPPLRVASLSAPAFATELGATAYGRRSGAL